MTFQKAKRVKDAAEVTNVGFRKHILTTEWEHASLKIKLEQLNNELYYFERTKVRLK
jgi:hypothetical protein